MDATNINDNSLDNGTEASEWDKFFEDPEETEDFDGGEGSEDYEGGGEEDSGRENPVDVPGADDDVGEDIEGGFTEGGEGQQTPPGFTPEQQMAIARQAQRQVDAFYKQQYAGFINPYTQKPIETEADYHAYMQAFEAEEQQRKLDAMGVDQNMLNELISNNPVVKQAQFMLAQQQQTAANDFMNKEFAALKQEYPDCGFDDPRAMHDTPEGREVLELWRDSPRLTLSQAYMLMNSEKIKAKQTAAVKQGVINQMNSKKHLTQTKGGGTAAEMPEADREALHKWFPKDTPEQLQERWLKNQRYSEK